MLTDLSQGLGIALVAASKAGVPVTLVDNSQASIDKGLKFAGQFYMIELGNGISGVDVMIRQASSKGCVEREDVTK